MLKIRQKRWQIAQESEKKFWDSKWKQGLAKKENLSKDYWKFHMNILKKYVKITKKTKILEIGGGANPFISAFPACKKYSLDPMMEYFKSNFKLPKGVKYIEGIGEKLPFKEESIDIVLITNVIDHVNSPKKVLLEIKRVLKKKGLVYLSVDCYTFLLKNYKIVKELLGIGDPCHPHSFSLMSITKLIKQSGFEVLYIKRGIGTQGLYTIRDLEEKTTKVSNLKKAIKIIKEKGIIIFIDSLVNKTLISIGNLISPERDRMDFIFAIGKI